MRLIQLVFAALVSVFACTACYWLVALNVMTRVTALQLAIDGQPELAGRILTGKRQRVRLRADHVADGPSTWKQSAAELDEKRIPVGTN